jgi:GTP-binding protein
MLNCLAGGGKPIAIESKTPGRTRAINLFHCTDSAGDICNFVDLPGYGFAKMSKSEKEELSQVVHEYLHKRESLMLCIVLIDPRRGPMESDYSLLNVRILMS